MDKIKLYQVDAFTDSLFSGNPAAVCVLDSWIDEKLMQCIGSENNLAETAFVVPRGKDYEIRWFTPAVEVDLCGHATLASAFVLFNLLGYKEPAIRFYSHKSGLLSVRKKDELLMMDFPTDRLELLPEEQNTVIEKCIGRKPIETYQGKMDYITVIEHESDLESLQPNLNEIAKLKTRGLVVTAKGEQVDFVSRFFAPQSGIPEDPVTGSSHTSLLPLWAKKLNKTTFTARQLSKRGGQLICEYRGDRCLIGGNARLYMTGEINI